LQYSYTTGTPIITNSAVAHMLESALRCEEMRFAAITLFGMVRLDSRSEVAECKMVVRDE
jgi:hypothetical protein